MRAKDSSTQCHRYKGQLTIPINRQARLASTVLLSHAFGPAAMIRYAPVAGRRAQKPGNALAGMTLTSTHASRAMPVAASTLLRISRAEAAPVTGINGSDRLSKIVV